MQHRTGDEADGEEVIIYETVDNTSDECDLTLVVLRAHPTSVSSLKQLKKFGVDEKWNGGYCRRVGDHINFGYVLEVNEAPTRPTSLWFVPKKRLARSHFFFCLSVKW